MTPNEQLVTFLQDESHPVLVCLKVGEYLWDRVDFPLWLELWADPMVEGLEAVGRAGRGSAGHHRPILLLAPHIRSLLQSHFSLLWTARTDDRGPWGDRPWHSNKGLGSLLSTYRKDGLFFCMLHSLFSSFGSSSCKENLTLLSSAAASVVKKVQNNLRHMIHFDRKILQRLCQPSRSQPLRRGKQMQKREFCVCSVIPLFLALFTKRPSRREIQTILPQTKYLGNQKQIFNFQFNAEAIWIHGDTIFTKFTSLVINKNSQRCTGIVEMHACKCTKQIFWLSELKKSQKIGKSLANLRTSRSIIQIGEDYLDHIVFEIIIL